MGRTGRPKRASVTVRKELYDTMETARLLSIDPRTVQNLAKAGRLPAVRIGRQWRFNRRALDALITCATDTPPMPPSLKAA